MASVTIKVNFINPPKEGKKMGSIKASDEKYYWARPELLNQFAKGEQYTLEYTSEMSGGKEWRTIKSLTPAVGDAYVSNGKASGGRDQSKVPMEIFVTGIIGRALEGSGGIPDVEQLTAMVRTARQAWEKGMSDGSTEKAKQAKQPEQISFSEEIDDEIPF